MDATVALAGLIVGFLVGLTGMGSGSLMAPFLIFVGVRPVVAVGTDLAYAAITKVVGAWQHHRLGTVDSGVALHLAAGSIPASILGVGLTVLLGQQRELADLIVTRTLGVTVILVGVATLLRLALRHDAGGALPRLDVKGPLAWHLVLLGAIVGFLVGVTSVGSGTLVALVLLVSTPLLPRVVVGTDIFHAALLLGAAALAHGSVGNVDVALAGNLLVGSVPGVVLGSRLSAHLPSRALKVLLGLVLVGCGIKLLV